MADIISSIISVASAVAGCFVTPIGRQLGYLFNYRSNVEDLKTQVQKLEVVRGKMQTLVDAARNNVEEIFPDVENWLESTVNGITEKAGEILLEDEDKAKKRCLNGLYPNLKSRYRLSKKAKKMAEKVVAEIQDGKEKLGNVSYRPPPQGTIGSTSNKGYEDFESRMSTLKKIMEALRNPNINMIGVYGMGGVGKTMLVKEAARKAMEDKLFGKVVVAVVSQSPNVRKIQEVIASPLGLRFDDKEIESERVERLCKRLNEEKSILIILDDVWAQLDLEALGIPLGDMRNGCKIVVTSRRLDLLFNQMNILNNFKIEDLHEEEAWNLFKKMAGDSVEAPEIEPTARKVAKECAGLPIAVVVVASALKKKGLHFWKNALYQLKKSAPTTIEGMDAKVYSSLKWSYDFLECEEQKLFLLCSLLPEDYQFSIQDLLNYGKGVGLFQGIEKLETARNSVHALVDRLKESCLLLDGDTSGLSKMHDVVRDVGISVAKDKHMLIVRNKVELEEWTTEEKLRFCSALSLPFPDIHELPTSLESPQLKFFLFFSEEDSLKIPDTFFEEMKQLKVLTLANIHFSSLHFPSSLQTLCLDWCQLGDIRIIAELKKLEILSFRGSNIRELPREIGQLNHLKLLDLGDCEELKVIPSNVIARLSQLEELNMEESFNRWEVDGNASLAELKHLPRLVTLNMHILDANILPNDLVFEKLIRYKILIGEYGLSKNEISRTLNLAVNTSIHLLYGINKLLKRTEHLRLKKLNGFKSMINDLDGEGFPDLKYLRIENSSEIEYVINTMSSTRVKVPLSAFPNLESLFLQRLIELKEICNGQLPVESFCNLRRVEVIGCDRLQNLFPLSVATSLSKLQEIKINQCKNMDGIVAEETEAAEDNNEAMDEIRFPQLHSLTLQDLPKLMCFCSKVKAVPSTSDAGRSKEIISEGEHGISIPLFNEKVAFPILEKLIIKSIAMKEIWHSQLPLPEGSFLKLKHLEVEDCFDLSKIVPSNMLMRQLQNVESMLVRRCGDYLEYIFDVGGINLTESRHVVRTSCELRDLGLHKLPGLINIWKNDSPGVFPLEKLSLLKVDCCPNLQNIFTSFRAKSLVQLKEVFIRNCDKIEEIVGKEGVDEEEATDKLVFPQVTSLNLERLPQLKRFCQGIRMSEWPFLKTLNISFCDNVEIFASKLGCFKETCGKVLFLVDKVAFPKLEELYLFNLPKLTTVWKKDSQGLFQDAVEEIVGKEGVEEVFPHLTSLILGSLPQLKNGIHISEWPSLKKLEVFNCKNVEILASDFSSFEKTSEKGHLGTPTKPLPLFLADKVAFPKLEILYLTNLPKLTTVWKKDSQGLFQDTVEEIVGKEGVEEVFPQLTSLTLKGLPQLKNGIHISEWPSLKKLEVDSCNNVEIFASDFSSFEKTSEKGHLGTPTKPLPLFLVDKVAFPNLEELVLFCLPRLMAVWMKDSQGSLNFQKLSSLRIYDCESLINVFTTSLAQKEEEAAIAITDKIMFPQVKSLSLGHLKQLKSFCEWNHISEWPSLEKLKMFRCNNVEIFASELSTFKETRGNANLGTPTKQPFFFVDKVAFPNLEELELQDLPKLMAVWMKDSQGSLNFQKLSSLRICHCESLINVFTTSMAKNLAQLQDTVEEIIEKEKEEEEEEAETMDKIMFPQVKSLTFERLKQLKSFCEWIYISEWPSLEKLKMSECHNVEIFSSELSTFKETRGKANLVTPTKQPLFLIDKVAFPNLEKMELNGMSSMEVIWQGQFHAHSFCKLRVLKVEKCDKILKVFPISLLRNLQNLKELSVKGCCSLEDVFELEGGVGEAEHASTIIEAIDEKGKAIDETTVYQLNSLYLTDLPNLTSVFFPENNKFSFPYLKNVRVESCPKLKTVSRHLRHIIKYI